MKGIDMKRVRIIPDPKGKMRGFIYIRPGVEDLDLSNGLAKVNCPICIPVTDKRCLRGIANINEDIAFESGIDVIMYANDCLSALSLYPSDFYNGYVWISGYVYERDDREWGDTYWKMPSFTETREFLDAMHQVKAREHNHISKLNEALRETDEALYDYAEKVE